MIALGLKEPTPWTPQIIPISIVRLGQLALIGVPAEFTTMSGRRTRETIENILAKKGIKYSVLASYANGYAGYVATPEEYQVQDYEGASTHFGEWTLPAYQQELAKLATAMVKEEEVFSSVFPLDLTLEKRLATPRNPPSYDTVPRLAQFGQQIGLIKPIYSKGETIGVDFWSSYPNRDMLTQSSFLEVQKKEGHSWKKIRYDWDFDTKYIYKKMGKNQSIARIEWDTTGESESGVYRILHRAVARNSKGKRIAFEGISTEFELR